MPSRDPVTGRRLSGSAQERLKAAAAKLRAAAAKLREIPEPPLGDGVIAVSGWAVTQVLPVCAELAALGADVGRVRVLQAMIAKLGKMRDKAARAEQALAVREDRKGMRVNVLAAEAPRGDVLAILPWSFMRLAGAILEAARERASTFSRDRYLTLADCCATAGYLPPNAAIDELLDELDPQAPRGT